ncbi:acyclic terpene utilization AtuA family protein [Frankia sp. AgKG'84/4]|uniref:acyclic terpene utilization AtuA family protein n=1 Tax=Frankia sp. AgKG'84/4 TaxID=573490 RepID=UPI002029BF9E|nr:acyclic terpene utilization AtuA family protein [Frankia sp. AgKG'84/4]MCL9795768.1 acyclic terpene utilization AtuA family protein [Frankia sp. AgKG'84/4]
MVGDRRPVRIANCSGFYGDRLDAARLMVDGGPIDVLTGDYLAELTMLILWKARARGGPGYARTFVDQVTDVLGTCLQRGIRIVTNAGGLDPAGLAATVARTAAEQGLTPRIAHITGDDLAGRLDELTAAGERFTHLDTGRDLADAGVEPVTANAYLGGWGIAAALAGGADVVVTPRVTDASLVLGPAAWWHGWARTDWDRLAGAVAAGHVIECGPQATGGNYAFLEEITDARYPGFPIAEVAADGSSVITKHPGTGGLVSVGTVTAQLLYEIAAPDYPGPDVTAHFDTARLVQRGPDRVSLAGTRGSPPTNRLKVVLNYLGGYRNTMTLVLTGLDIERKAAWARRELFDLLGGEESFDEVDVRLLRFDRPDAESNALATAQLRITVKDSDRARVGRAFSNATQSLVLGSYAGVHTTTTPTAESAYGVYWPVTIDRRAVEQRVVFDDGTSAAITHSPAATGPAAAPIGTVPAHAEEPVADEFRRRLDERRRLQDGDAVAQAGVDRGPLQRRLARAVDEVAGERRAGGVADDRGERLVDPGRQDPGRAERGEEPGAGQRRDHRRRGDAVGHRAGHVGVAHAVRGAEGRVTERRRRPGTDGGQHLPARRDDRCHVGRVAAGPHPAGVPQHVTGPVQRQQVAVRPAGTGGGPGGGRRGCQGHHAGAPFSRSSTAMSRHS